MATPKGGTAIEGGIVTRLAAGVRMVLTGQAPDAFFGPGTSMAPVAQEQAEGRAFDYPVAFNLSTRPRANDPIDFPTLRALADACDLVRLAIETRKDQMGKLPWTIQRRDTGEQDAQAKRIADFLQTPDGEHDFLEWSRSLLEDVLVIDAPAVYLHRTRGGDPYALEQIDGATIKRILDPRGRTPAPPDPAYAQIIKGLPAANYTRDELVYKPRNPRIHKAYGYSPVEQILVIVNLALRRQASQLNFYTDGNVPDMLMGTPKEWSPQQIKEFQTYWDLLLSGDLAAQRRLRFVPDGVKSVALRPESSLFDTFDEWIARVVSYSFSLPPTAFVKQVNRATAETAQDTALSEGLAPIMEWKVRFMNRLIQLAWGTTDYVFAWLDEQSIDPQVQAEIDAIYVENGIREVNEVRADHGWEPLDEPAPTVPPAVPAVSPTDAPADGAQEPEPADAAAAKLLKRRSRRQRRQAY